MVFFQKQDLVNYGLKTCCRVETITLKNSEEEVHHLSRSLGKKNARNSVKIAIPTTMSLTLNYQVNMQFFTLLYYVYIHRMCVKLLLSSLSFIFGRLKAVFSLRYMTVFQGSVAKASAMLKTLFILNTCQEN